MCRGRNRACSQAGDVHEDRGGSRAAGAVGVVAGAIGRSCRRRVGRRAACDGALSPAWALPAVLLVLWGWDHAALQGNITDLIRTWCAPVGFVVALTGALVVLLTRGLSTGRLGLLEAIRWTAPSVGLVCGLFLTYATLTRFGRLEDFGPPLTQALIMAMSGVLLGLVASALAIWRTSGQRRS